MKSLRETVETELAVVREALNSERDEDTEALEGWKQALKWVLEEIAKGGQK
jgi:hypothetical protein